MRILSIVLLILLGVNGISALAESQRTVLYDYDEAGNLVAVRTIEVGGAPVINSIEPFFLRRNTTTRFIASGLNLNEVQISNTASQLQISSVSHISDTEVEFDLFTVDASLGAKEINFSNLLGSTTQFITVAERLRIIATNPSPLIFSLGKTQLVSVRIDEPFDVDKQFEVTVSNSLVVSVLSDNSFTLPAGQSEFDVIVDGLSLGNAQLVISQINDSLTNTVAVSVLAPVTLGSGTHIALARIVGVRLQLFTGVEAVIYTKPIGVSRRVLFKAGESIESAPVGVELLTE